MTARLQEELAALLCDAECVSSPARREQLVWKLPSTLKHRLDVAHPPDVFARGLVHHAASRELLGAVLRWIDTMDDSSNPVRRAREAAAPLVHREETQALAEVLGAMAEDSVREVDAVRERLTRLAYEDVKDLYLELGAGRLDAVVSPTPRNAWEALADLSLLTLPLDGAHPLHTFCAVLARHCGGAAEAPLKKWGQDGRVGREPGSDRGEAAAAAEAWAGSGDATWRYRGALEPLEPPEDPELTDTDTDTRPPARLVVWVTYADRRDRFLLEHWAHLRDTPHGAVEFREHGQPGSLGPEEIGSYVCGLITGLQGDRSIGFHSGIRVEWVLPLPLIQELRAELWQQAIAPSDAVGDQRMGARAQVVYRLAEFVGRRDDWNGAWEACDRRWARLDTVGNGSLFDAHSVNSGSPEVHGSDLPFQLIHDDDLAIYATGSCSHENWVEDVGRVVAAGVPVVVWRSPRHRLRISDALGKVKGDVKTEVPLARIRNLPVLLHRSRMQRLRRGDPGYIEDSFGVSLIFHDAQPVSPPEAAPLSVSTIQYPPPGAVGRAT